MVDEVAEGTAVEAAPPPPIILTHRRYISDGCHGLLTYPTAPGPCVQESSYL